MKKWEPIILRVTHDSGSLGNEIGILYKQGFKLVTSNKVPTNFDKSEVLLLFFHREIHDPPTEREGCHPMEIPI